MQTGACVECASDAECTEPANARCDESGTCVPCTADAQCEGIEGRPVCHEGACTEGCTAANEATVCGQNACNTATMGCTDVERGSLEVCEPCVADSQCGDGGSESADFRCVPMDYESARYPDSSTGFCLKTTEGGCERPYSITLDDLISLSEAPADDYCGINESLTTCDAVRALLDDVQCPGSTDNQCPTGGLCRTVGALANRCTYACSDPVQCKDVPNPGSTCEGGPPDYCGGSDG